MIPEYTEDGEIEFPDEPSLTEAERRNYDRFITEYMVDYSYTNAAIRIGFASNQAHLWGQKFRYIPYIERRIAEAMHSSYDDLDAMETRQKQRVLNSLMKEANYRGPGASHAARVSALAKLAQIHGLEAPTKTEATVKQDINVSHAIDYSKFDPEDLIMVRKLLEKRAQE